MNTESTCDYNFFLKIKKKEKKILPLPKHVPHYTQFWKYFFVFENSCSFFVKTTSHFNLTKAQNKNLLVYIDIC